MKPQFAQFHLDHMNRRDALKLGAAGAAAAVAGATMHASPAAAQEEPPSPPPDEGVLGVGPASGTYSDAMFNLAAVLAGEDWTESRYGPGDERGTFNELTPYRTARALRILDATKDVKTYQLGEEMFNGFPAFPSNPPRLHDMFLYILGYEAPEGFVEAGGIQAQIEAFGPNQLSAHEERFAENFTFQIATQIDGLNHIGVGDRFYNGFRGPDIATPTGTSALGNETMGPVTTRGLIYDVIGLKVAQGRTEDYFIAENGQPVLQDDYRISLDDMQACLRRQGNQEIRAGEVPMFNTGWTHLVKSDPGRYLSKQPGIYLEEARYFAARRVALVASDTWGLECLDPAITNGNAFPAHQVLIVGHGVRIGESFVVTDAAADHAYEGVLVATPENVPGATCGSTPPCFMAQPGPAPDDAILLG